jgi:outer membrane receptor protein involved in Fe transport
MFAGWLLRCVAVTCRTGILLWFITAPIRFAAAQTPTGAAADRGVEGIVIDPQNLPISGARITIVQRQGSTSKTALSGTERFRLDNLAPAVYDVHIEAEGFEPQDLTADLRNEVLATLEVRLQPARLNQQIVVAATRTEQRLGDVPASVSVLRREEIQNRPAAMADEVLRQIPTFSLFRRTSSLAAHPTAQGVSLRSIGPSAVSRSLVLLDGIPFNDPFGGWVYWTRVPLLNIDRIEVVDSANSSLYGNYALGGVINFVSSPPSPRTIILKPQYGGRRNPKLGSPGSTVWDGIGAFDFYASDVWNKVGAAVEGSIFNTNGYPTVPERDFDGSALRGPVDTKATASYQNLNLRLDYNAMGRVSASFRGGYFSEVRSNAKTCFQAPIHCDETNDTLWKFVTGGVRLRMPDESDLQARVFANFETFHSSFLAIPAAIPSRSIGRLSLLQTVPSKDTGFMLQWSKPVAGRHYFTAGTDWHWVDGDSREDSFNQTTGFVQLQRVAGGTQQSFGVFAQDVISATSRLQLTLSARLDHWRNYDPHNLETGTGANNRPSCAGVANPATQPCLAEKKDTVGSPRVGALYRLSDSVNVWGAVSWAFRAPTLNELYRQFQVGAVLTQPNASLGPERLTGGETGVNFALLRDFTWRTTWFINRVKNPVSNVTLPTPANRRQRQNLGTTRIYGIQNDVEYRFRSFRFSGGYLYNMATVREYAADPSQVGRFLAQVPRHRGSMQLAYANPRYGTLGVSAQFMSRQFEDPPILPYDQNLLRLPGYGVVDLNASRVLSPNIEAFFGIQNLFNRVFYVQRTPTTIGAPRSVTGGFKITFRGL